MADLNKWPMWEGDRGDAAGMTDDIWERSNWARRRCLDDHGHYLILVSGNRTYAQQVQLRRQNCGTTYFAIYEASPLSCHPVTAKPGTSNHEEGKAGDWSPGPRSCSRCRAIWREAGLTDPVKSEDWHWEVAPGAGPLPDTPPPPDPVPPEDDIMPLPNDYLIAHRDRGEFLVNGLTKLASHMPSPDTVQWVKNLYTLAHALNPQHPELEDHRDNVDDGTALIDFRAVNVVATQ